MKYKSELINEIVENEGHCSPTLHYESECIGYWIESIRGSYPKLTDYEGEWLNYYLENEGIGKFPYLALNNITSTTVENTVPIQFKSAILKGCTIKTRKITWLTGKYLDNLSGSFANGVEKHRYTEEFFECEPNTIYELIGDNNYKKLCFYDTNKTFISGYSSNTSKFDSLKQQSPSNACYLRISTSLTPSSELTSELSEELTVYNHSLGISVIGTNIEDKILSVKMPVLTTSNEDGTKTNILTVNEDITLRSNGDVYDELNLLTGRLTQRIDENNEVLAQAVVKTVDLSIIDESGNSVSKLKAMNGTTHIETNGTPLTPTFSGEIPVEAIPQNLNSFIEEE